LIQSIQDFEIATEFERRALEEAVPGFRFPVPASVTLELWDSGSTSLAVGSVSSSSSVGDVAKLRANVRPLLFGAAWKILDLLVELALANARIPPDNKKTGEYRITTKQSEAPKGICPSLSSHPQAWAAIAEIYGNTAELRHCLVHRTATVATPSGEFNGTNKSGIPLQPLTSVEQDSFCLLALICSEAVIAANAGKLSKRQYLRIAGHLDQLHLHHSAPRLGGIAATSIIRVDVKAVATASGFELDTDLIRPAAIRRTPNAAHAFLDVYVHDPNGHHPTLCGSLEDAPPGVSSIDFASPPAWLRS
jgi:hypothetical protein